LSEILVCRNGRVKRDFVNFFRSIQTASDWLYGRPEESGA
jgi:hypothetical protein